MVTVIPLSPGADQPALVGRQPILDRHARVVGYELLFRHPSFSSPAACDGDAATADVIVNTFLEIGFDEVVGPHDAYINASRGFLLAGFAHQLPARRVVVEILETVEPDRHVLASIAELKSAGYRIALDDFRYRPELDRLVDAADLVKIDLEQLGPPDLWTERLMPLRGRVPLLAERVESTEQFERAAAAGFELFQGFHFARTAVVRGQRMASNRLALLRVLALVSDPGVGVEELAAAIATDVALSYRLLRTINSAWLGLATGIDSLSQAIVYLGRERIRSWVALMALVSMGPGTNAVATMALIRAHMCQTLARETATVRSESGFMVGLLSALDVLLATPMDEVVRHLPVSDDVKRALTRRDGDCGILLDTVLAYERWDLEAIRERGQSMPGLRQAYLDAMRWVHRQGIEQAVAAS